MSMAALLRAVRDHLRVELSLAHLECDVEADGQPPPSAGERYVSVHEAGWTVQDCEGGLDEVYAVDVTVTMKAGKVPMDSHGTNVIIGPTGQSLDKLCRDVLKVLHMDRPSTAAPTLHYPVLRLANAEIGVLDNGFVEPLRLRSVDIARPVGPEWFSAVDQSDPQYGPPPPVGLARALHFVGARRIQVIEEQD